MDGEIKELTSLLDRLEGEKREAEKQAMTSGHLLRQLESEIGRVSERAGTCSRELQRLAMEREQQQQSIASCQSELTQMELARLELEHNAATAQLELAGLAGTARHAVSAASHKMASVATLEERHRSAAAVLQRIEAQLAELGQRVSALRQQIESSFAELLHRAHENQELADQLVNLDAERNASEARDGLLQVESEQVRARLTEIDEALHQARQLLDQARDRRDELTAAAAKLQSDLQYMSETCLNELGIERDELVADTTIEIVSGEQLTVEDQIYRDMRARLDAMGPVNMMALEEYKETAERHGFLETQRKDLLESIQNTQADHQRD